VAAISAGLAAAETGEAKRDVVPDARLKLALLKVIALCNTWHAKLKLAWRDWRR